MTAVKAQHLVTADQKKEKSSHSPHSPCKLNAWDELQQKVYLGMILCNMALLLYRLQIAIYLSYPVTKFSHLTFKLELSLSRLEVDIFLRPTLSNLI